MFPDVSLVSTRAFARSRMFQFLAGLVALVALVALWSWNPGWLARDHLTPSKLQFWFHAGIDASIGLSYLAISASLVYLVYRARDAVPYHHLFLAFGGFILSCGLGHFAHIWTTLYPGSRLEGYLGLLTAATSIATAASLPPLIPKILHMIDSAKLSEQRRAMIQQQNEFFTTVTHELKTPLTAVLGFEELLKRRIAKDGTVSSSITGAVTMLSEQTQRLARLVDSLLDLSRIQRGKYILQRRSLDMTQLVTGVVDRFRVTLPGTHELRLDAPAAPLWLAGDDLALEQLLFNLLQNAVKYSPSGGLIGVSVDHTDDTIRINVVDQGIGIPAEDQARLCEQFYRGSNVDGRKMSGFGVGLYVTQEILRQHEGRLEITSAEGVGSTFTIVLPRMEVVDTTTAHPSDVARSVSASQ